MESQVYINWGRLVADCPQPGCSDARAVEPGQKAMICVSGHQSALQWPDNMPQIMTVLSERTAEKRRNWFPAGHPFAVAAGLPHGQTLDDLRREATAGEAADAAYLASRRAELLAQMRELGVTADEALTVLKGS